MRRVEGESSESRPGILESLVDEIRHLRREVAEIRSELRRPSLTLVPETSSDPPAVPAWPYPIWGACVDTAGGDHDR